MLSIHSRRMTLTINSSTLMIMQRNSAERLSKFISPSSITKSKTTINQSSMQYYVRSLSYALQSPSFTARSNERFGTALQLLRRLNEFEPEGCDSKSAANFKLRCYLDYFQLLVLLYQYKPTMSPTIEYVAFLTMNNILLSSDNNPTFKHLNTTR
jgi:hypothetical protein